MLSADLLREARLRAGLTQAELGRRVGKPQSVISRWERGEVEPSLETLRQLIRACDLELSFRLTRRDDHDRVLIERSLDLTPAERLSQNAAAVRSLGRITDSPLALSRG